ncbi:hypothetical protein CDEN61S_00150 [Castellaniella denitrificans]
MLQQRQRDFAGDSGALARVRGREGLVEEHECARLEVLDHPAHAGQFFVELAAFQGRVLFALVVRQDTRAETARPGLGRNEHPALHHELGHPHGAQERRLAPLVGARDHAKALAVGRQVVAHHLAPHVQRQANIVEPLAGADARMRRRRGGKHDRRIHPGQSGMQIQAGDIEGQLRAQRRHESQDVLRRLRERVGHLVDPASTQFGQGLRARLVARRKLVAEGHRLPAEDAPQPRPFRRGGPAQDIVFALVAPPQASADQDPVAEPQRVQVRLDLREIIFAQFPPQHGEERRESGRRERLRIRIGEGPKLPEHADVQQQHLPRTPEYRGHEMAEAPIGLLAHFQGLGRHRVQARDGFRIPDAIPQDGLAIQHGLGRGAPGQQRRAGHLVQEFILAGHRPQQDFEFQVLDEVGRVPRFGPVELEVGVGMHQMRFHRALPRPGRSRADRASRRPRRASASSPYFSAIDMA